MKKRYLHAIAWLVAIGISLPGNAQLAAGKSKWLGNIIASSAPSNFSTYWNQVTPENSGKWVSVEGTRNSMNWSQLDIAYNYAKGRGYPFKQHTFVWGNQEPGWIGSLSATQQRAEVEEWIRLYGQRYPNTDFIDVVNEPLSAPASYRNALGGSGSTGWDWIVWSFQRARQYCPNAKLLINEYGIINDANKANQYIQIVNVLKARGLIDGIGIQCHAFNVDNTPASTMQSNLNLLAATGVPIYVSELDIRGDDNLQLQRYQEKFPVLWNHSGVKGITLWGYIEGQTWLATTHLVRSNGTERPALQWLRTFLNGSSGNRNIVIRARGTNGSERVELRVNNTVVNTWTMTTGYQNYSATAGSGTIRVQFINDASGRDVQVDYIQVNGATHQAEVQSTNTGVWQNSACGGTNSEWMHCNGYIQFSSAGSMASPAATASELNVTGEEEGWKIYPNPAIGKKFVIDLPEGVLQVRVLDITGRVVKLLSASNNRRINLELDVLPGTYLLQMVNREKRVVRKIVVN
jgi:endo-1,4-beta-xylanase